MLDNLTKNQKIALFAITAAIFLTLISYTSYKLAAGLPSLNRLEEYRPKLASKVYSSDGKLIHTFFSDQRRTYVPIEEMPPYMWQAVVAVEDKRFFSHWGLDMIRIVNAVIINTLSLDIVHGASTITQQLARQLYLNQSLEQTFTRKIREQITAIQIERTYTKKEILDIYLNFMNFGHGSYGVQSAAKFYFGKDAKDLSIDECALLAGVLQRPSSLSPYVNPEFTLKRRNLVLASMKSASFVNDDEYKELIERPLGVLDEKPTSFAQSAPYFIEYIRQQLQQRYGMDLYDGGLTIETTLDSRAQTIAERMVNRQIDDMQRRMNRKVQRSATELQRIIPRALLDSLDVSIRQLQSDTTRLHAILTEVMPVQAALISIDPRNGHILAMVGGRDFEKYKFNRATQARRQAGSAFKPFLYTAVIDNGYPPTLELLNQPVVVFLETGERWSPHNYDQSIGGLITIREALKKSLNLISVRMIQEVTKPSVVVDYAHKLGLTTPIPAVDAIALGAGSVIPIEITRAFGAFANQGVLMDPIAVVRVLDRHGNILEENIPHGKEVLRRSTAYIITDLLKGVIDGGTGGRTRWMYDFRRPTAGKTGTTNDYTDAWFVGYTPQIATGVWVGFDDPARTFGSGYDGARVALPIWAPYMKATHDTMRLRVEDFSIPDDVVRAEVCLVSKKLANPECPSNQVINELFIREFEPSQFCDVHTSHGRMSERRRRSLRQNE